MCVYNRGVRAKKGRREDGGRERQQPLAFLAGVFCSALQVCSGKAAASHSYQSPVKQKHEFSIAPSMVTVAKY